MKNVKFLKSLIALSCVFTLGLGVMSGCNKEPECEHVYTWTVNEESTCTTKGRQTGKCGICGDVKVEELPLDETKHVYTGDWDITKQPTEEANGVAVKTCANNPAHKTEVTLPKVTVWGTGYDSREFITKPTAAREGEIKLTLKSIYGDITFNAPLAKRTLNNMDDAVILASSLQENVRSVEGYFLEQKGGIQNKFSYYFGDDYTRIDDGSENKVYFYSLDDDGKVYAMSDAYGKSDSYYDGTKGVVVSKPDEGCINGYHYNSSVNISSFYGAEQGLARLYETAMNGLEDGTTVNFQSTSKIDDGDYKFSYSYDSGDWFTRFEVTFSYNYVDSQDVDILMKNGTLTDLTVQTEIIRSFMYVTDEDKPGEGGSAVFYKEDDKSVTEYGEVAGDIIFGFIYPTAVGGGNDYETYIDEKGNSNYVFEQKDASGNLIYEKHTENGVEYYAVTYENELSDNPTINYEKLSGKPEGLEYVYVTDRNGNTVYDANGEPIKKIMARDCYPVFERYSDNHEYVSYKTVNFKQTLKSDNDVVPENKYSSASRYIQNFDIVGVKSGSTTIPVGEKLTLPTNQVITLTLGNFTPATANLKTDPIDGIYVVDETGNRIKLIADFNQSSKYKILGFFTPPGSTVPNGTITIKSKYAGDVKFILTTQSGKCEKEVNVTFTKSAPQEGQLIALASVYKVVDGSAQSSEQVVSASSPVKLIVGQSLKFKAYATGEEAAYVSTDIYPASTAGITFNQPEKDNFTDWELVATAPGEYIIKMPYYDGTTSSESVYAEFKVIVSPKLSVTETLSGNTFSGNVLIAQSQGNPASQPLTAVFSPEGEIAINVAGNDIVYTYTVNEATRAIDIKWKSGLGPENKTYDFSFSINEAGDLVITHHTGFGNNTEDIILTKVTEE